MKLLSTHKHKLLALTACMIPLSGYAADASSDLSYGYVELDYLNLDIDTGDEDISRSDLEDGDGYGLSVSIPVSERFFIYGDYSETEADFTFRNNLNVFVPGGTDVNRFNLGLGFRAPLSASTDMVFSGGYVDVDYGDFDLGGSSSLSDIDDDGSDGYSADFKLRSQLSPALEGSIGARYTDIEDADGVSLIGNLMYEFSPNWGLNLSVDAGSDLMTWAAGVRYSF